MIEQENWKLSSFVYEIPLKKKKENLHVPSNL